jgi:UDP-N-acetyl-D-galactosamine dehydrogenase
MGKFVAEQTVKRLIQSGRNVKDTPIVVLGLTFKEDVPDLRNSKVIDVVRELESFGAKVYIHDPIADADEAMHEYGVTLTPWDALPQASAMVAAVSHREYKAMSLSELGAKLAPGGVFADVKCAFDRDALAAAGYVVWRL